MAQATENAIRATDRLGTKGVWSLLFEFSIPAIGMMLFSALYNVIDSVFLGQAVGPDGIAVATLANPLMMVYNALSALSGVGGNALAAIALGAGQYRRLEKILGNTTTLLCATSVLVMTVMFIFFDPILRLVGTTDELYAQTWTFMMILTVAYPIQCIGLGLNNFLRTAGKPTLAMVTNIAGTAVCIALNYVFVIMMGMGVAGSALATVCGQTTTFIPTVYYLIRGKDSPFYLHVADMKADFGLMRSIQALGLASFAMQVAATIVSILLNQSLVAYGDLTSIGSEGALSSVGVSGRVNSFAMMPVMGVTMGAQTLIGYNYGARNWKRVKASFWDGVIFSTAIFVVFYIIIRIWPTQIANLFGVTGELEVFTVYALHVMNMAFPILGFQFMGSTYFQSSGQPLKATVLGLTRQFFFFIPLIFLLPLAMPGWLGTSQLESVLYVYPVADVLSVALTLVFVVAEWRRLGRLQREDDEKAALAAETEEAEDGEKAALTTEAEKTEEAALPAKTAEVAEP